jgi:hypothetical protein
MLPAGWGNNELQCYQNTEQVARVVPNPDGPPGDGMLLLTAERTEQFECVNEQARRGRPALLTLPCAQPAGTPACAS